MGLRPYQNECVASVQNALAANRSTLYILATGCGKTQVFSELCRVTPGRIMVLAHRNELIEQAALRIE